MTKIWTAAELIEDGRETFDRCGDRADLNPFINGPGRAAEARLWHQGFAQRRAERRIGNPQPPRFYPTRPAAREQAPRDPMALPRRQAEHLAQIEARG